MPASSSLRRSVPLRVENLEPRCVPTASDWISSLYANFLQRLPQPSEQAAWQGALQAGTSPVQVALGITTSDEYRINFIRADYEDLLGRQPGGSEEASWLGAMGGGVGEDQVTSLFLASPEFLQKNGATDAAWVTAVYQDVLGRAPDPAGLATWLQDLQHEPYAGVASAIVDSPEANARVVTAAFRQLLERDPDPAGLAFWTGALNQGLAPEQMLADIASSPEYFQLQAPGKVFPTCPTTPVAEPGSGNQTVVCPTGPTTVDIPPAEPPDIPAPPDTCTDTGTQDTGTVDTGTVDTGTEDQGTVDPGACDPGYTDPGYTDPSYTDPGTSDPGYTDPGYTDPGYTDPGTSDSGFTDPSSGF